jgi:hypothetical protein
MRFHAANARGAGILGKVSENAQEHEWRNVVGQQRWCLAAALAKWTNFMHYA